MPLSAYRQRKILRPDVFPPRSSNYFSCVGKTSRRISLQRQHAAGSAAQMRLTKRLARNHGGKFLSGRENGKVLEEAHLPMACWPNPDTEIVCCASWRTDPCKADNTPRPSSSGSYTKTRHREVVDFSNVLTRPF